MKKIVIIAIALSFIVSSSGQAMAQSGQVKGKNWDIRLSGTTFYDDNVIQSPRNSANKPAGLGDESSWAFDFSGQGRYKFKLSDALTLAADYSLNNTNYTDTSQLDQLTNTFGADAAYFIPNTGNNIYRLNLRYFYMYNIIDNDSYNSINYISPSIMFMINQELGFTRINYTFTNEDNRQTILRDTDAHSVGIDHYYFISGNQQKRIRVGYAYRNEEAKGTINDLSSHTFRIELKTPLIMEIFLNAKYRYGAENYDTRAVLIGTGIRNDDRHDFSVAFSKELLKDVGILEQLTGFIQYQHINNDSTDKLFEHNKNVTSLMVKGKF